MWLLISTTDHGDEQPLHMQLLEATSTPYRLLLETNKKHWMLLIVATQRKIGILHGLLLLCFLTRTMPNQTDNAQYAHPLRTEKPNDLILFRQTN